jgi:hypothetical protein
MRWGQKPCSSAVDQQRPARQHCSVRLEPPPGHLQAELIQPAERGQVGTAKGSVTHVEVFPLGGVRTPIIGRPRPLPRHRRADPTYTLNCEEPDVDAALVLRAAVTVVHDPSVAAPTEESPGARSCAGTSSLTAALLSSPSPVLAHRAPTTRPEVTPPSDTIRDHSCGFPAQ